MKIFGFYISRTDWESLFEYERSCRKTERSWALDVNARLIKLQNEQSETYALEDGRLRFKHNGQFAPDNRSKFKQVHDQLRAEVAAGKYEPSDQVPHYDDIKNATKLKEFGE